MEDRSEIGKRSREKGKRGERMLAKELRKCGYDSRRGVQYNGSDGSADVTGLPGIHIECKFVENLNIKDAMRQSIDNAKEGEMPVVIHKKSRHPWEVTIRLSDMAKMIGGTIKNDNEEAYLNMSLYTFLIIYENDVRR